MAFGPPTRALKLNPTSLPGGVDKWDEMIEEANRLYSGRRHNLCFDNCHSHVAYALNKMQLRAYGISEWDMVKLCFLVFFRARFLSFSGLLKQFLPFVILVCLFVIPLHIL